ncbi:hypothetical protein PRZ48_012049 [Zasmidium cellare]|uniref:Uncharacterized protein n=1 Tax=Zasmidium cellare TaxID=395010 RepID=A0ABR0E3S4_ZASCE|nr:hypothetical protein PRZ48_012049 [Zasmidium cellare]
MTGAPSRPYRPYQDVHANPKGPGDARPTGEQIVKDCGLVGELKGKTILITGANSGLGITTAKALHITGAKLLLSARDVIKLDKVIEEIVQESPELPTPGAIELRLDSLQDVQRAAKIVESKTTTLDILICNAGIMAVPYALTEDGLESQVGVNHFAHFLLFQLLRPLMEQAAANSKTPSRVIGVSSAGHWFGGVRFEDVHFKRHPMNYNKWQAYGQSKTANIYMCTSITRHYASQGIIGLSVHPGAIATNLGRHLTSSDLEDFGAPPELMNAYKSPEQGAATTVWAVLSSHFDDVSHGGRYLADCGESGPTKPGAHAADTGYDPHVYDEEKEEKLWKLSLETLGI